MKYTLETLEEMKTEVYKKAKELSEHNEHKLVYSNPYARECDRIQLMIDLLESGAETVGAHHQGAVVNDYYIVGWNGGSWRTKKGNKWYRFKGAKHFIDTYVNNKPDFDNKSKWMPSQVYAMAKWNTDIKWSEENLGRARLVLLNNSVYVSSKKTMFRPKGQIDWAYYTPKGLATALAEGNELAYYEYMLKDERSPPNIWKRRDEEMEKKTLYAVRSGLAEFI